MIAANFNKAAQALLWCEAVDCANDLENITASTVRSEFPFVMFNGKPSKLYPLLQPFGRIGFVTIRKKIKATWKQKSTKMVMVGYAKNHAADTYRMYNPETKKISLSRDIHTWADWQRLDVSRDLSVFQQDPTLLLEPQGLDDQESDLLFSPTHPHLAVTSDTTVLSGHYS